jgi:phosphoadenosine phosphosulfate reductase
MSDLAINALPHAEQLSAEQLLAEIIRQSGGHDACLTSSFQAEDMVVLHLMRQHLPNLPVIFLETGYHFAALLEYRDRVVQDWKLNLVNALPATTVAQHEAQFGVLHVINPTYCCQMRKVEPLMRSLEPYTWWFTGLRREQSPTRAKLKKIEDHRLPSGKQMKKISLLADWTWDRVEAYATKHDIPRLSLYDEGYTSIGCEPCTARPAAGADPRSGRWGGTKLECGIHTFSERE